MAVVAPDASVATTLPSSPPVTIRSSSAAADRTAPAWTATRRSSPLRASSTRASSPRTNAAVSPRKRTSTTGASTVTGRVRSTTEGMSPRVSLMRKPHEAAELARRTSNAAEHIESAEPSCSARRAALEAFPDLALRQIAADEHHAAHALLARLPFALMVAVEDHVHTLQHEALVVILERQDALAAQDVGPLFLHQILHPGKELVGVERPLGRQRDRLHLFVVIVLEPAAAMHVVAVSMIMTVTMIMLVIMVMAVAMFVVVLDRQEFGLDVEDAIKVKGISPEHFQQRDPAALGGVQPRIGIDAADVRLDVGKLIRLHQVGLVDQDHVGEGDLVLGLGRVLEPVLEPFGVGDGHDRVKLGLAAHILVHKERLSDRRRVGEAGGLDNDGVELALAPHQAIDDAHEIAAHGAADAAVVHLEHFLVGAHDQVVVDADFTKLVDDDGKLLPVLLRQDAVEQRRLAGAKIAGQHRHRN